MRSNAVLSLEVHREVQGVPVRLDEYLFGLGLSPKTIRVYRQAIERAIPHINLDDCNPVELAAYTQQHVPNTSSSRRHFKAALTHYWEMTGRVNPPVKAVRVPRKPTPICRALEPADARALVNASLGWYPEGIAVLFGMYMALRREEIAQARWDRFDAGLDWYTVHGKLNKTATLPVHPKLQAELVALKNSTRYWRSGSARWIFPGSRGRDHVTPATVWGWVKTVCDEAGIARIQTHQLRHTAITTANDNTGDLRAVSEFARHSRLEETRRYTRTTAIQLRSVVTAIDY